MATTPPLDAPPSFLRVVGEILFWVVVVTVGSMLFGTIVTDAGRPIAFGIAGVITLLGWFTDFLEAPRGRVTTLRRHPPRRKRRTPKGAASRRRR